MKPRPEPLASAPATAFAVRHRVNRPDGTVAVTLQGHLDVEGSPILQQALVELRQEGAHNVELDCAGVRFISSVGVGVLIVAVGDFRAVGGDIAITGLNDEMRQMFEMLELTDYVTLK